MDGGSAERSYESLLHAVGAYLDAHCATEFRLLETPGGFAVRFEGIGDRRGMQTAYFRFADLRPAGIEVDFMHKVRHPLGPEDRKYRHLLSAIGHDLDDVHAVSILMDELPDSLLLTYEFDDPRHGYVLRKRMALAGPRDRERLLEAARHRRGLLKPRRAASWYPVMDISAVRH